MSAKLREYSAGQQSCQPGTHYIVDSIVAGIAPWRCVLCDQPAQDMDLCAACCQDLPWIGHACSRCALPLSLGGELCGRCQGAEFSVDRSIAALLYEYPVDRLVGALKFRRQLFLARVLAELLLTRVCKNLSDRSAGTPDLLMPVPLHAQRMAERTFNQATEIAGWVARRLKIEVSNFGLRVKSTQAQTGLSRRSRLTNMRGAFALTSHIRNRHVAIIDDVITTGATTNQFARVCKAAGAAEVEVWAVARTP